MQVYTFSVTSHGYKPDLTPRITFGRRVLAETGFNAGAAVQVIPEEYGLIFRVCDENIRKHHDSAQGGRFIKVTPSGMRIYGTLISGTGLNIGDPLIVRCEQGLLHVKKLTENIKIITIENGNVRIGGSWLREIGFDLDTVITVASEPGSVIIKRWEGPNDYGGIIKFARKNKLKFIQIQKQLKKRFLRPPRSVFEKAGLADEDVLVAEYGDGIIKLGRLDWKQLGF